MDKHEQILCDILNKSDRKLKAQFKDFYRKLERLIEQGHSDRVVLRTLDKEVKKLTKNLTASLSNSVQVALTASISKNKQLLNIVDFERIKIDLTSRIWNEKENIITPVKEALKEGLPSRDLAKQIVELVNTSAKGQGVYKEPIKNAMRVARTEITQAYRKQDNHLWGNIDFVIGKEIRLSNSPKKHARCEICRNMVGKYPKDFNFIGFHVNCLCYQIPIQLSDKDFEKWENGELDVIPNITDLPKRAVNFVDANRIKFAGWKTEPYWLKYFN